MNNTAVFCFGRYNPPHVGHELVIQRVGEVAESEEGSGYVFTSHTQDSEKNPLTWKEKIFFLSRMFPYANIITDEGVKNLFDAIAYLGKMGYTHVILVAGGDRVGKFKKQIKLEQVKEYGIEKFSVINAGYRDEGSVGTQAASSTKQRMYAVEGDFENFTKAIPNLKDHEKRKMYDIIRERLTGEE